MAGFQTLLAIAITGEIVIPDNAGAAAKLVDLVAAVLKIPADKIQYVDDLTPQAGAFKYDYNEGLGTRYDGTLYNLKEAKVVNNAQHCFVKSEGAPITVDFTAYVTDLNK